MEISIFSWAVDKLKSGMITFINMVTLTNRDFPYFDYATYADGEEPAVYAVGQNNIAPHGSQKKLFVAKSTLIYSDVACTVIFNNANNVATAIVANTWYEFKHNISQIIITAIATDGTIYIYCEGVLAEEQRSPL